LATYKKLNDLTEIILKEINNVIAGIERRVSATCIVADSDPSNVSYVKGLQKKASLCGVNLEVLELPSDINPEKFYDNIKKLNEDNNCCGIIIQNPIPSHIEKHRVFELIDYRKDLDGISYINQGRLLNGNPYMIPATAWAVEVTLDYISYIEKINLCGLNAVIAGRSVTVGKPAMIRLLSKNITPTIVHTKTQDIKTIASNADILVACCGVAELIDRSWVKPGAIVIDVGIHSKLTDEGKYKLCGDVNALSALENAFYLTAVPGGVGSVTSALLFANAVKAYFKIVESKEYSFGFENNK